MDRRARIFVAGHRGMVGSALVRRLRDGGYDNLLVRSRTELDLLDQRAVAAFVAEERPDYVFIAAAKVGGIQANDTLRADFLYENLVIEGNLIGAAHADGVERLTFLGHERRDGALVEEVELGAAAQQQVLVSALAQATHERGADHASMAGDGDARLMAHGFSGARSCPRTVRCRPRPDTSPTAPR